MLGGLCRNAPAGFPSRSPATPGGRPRDRPGRRVTGQSSTARSAAEPPAGSGAHDVIHLGGEAAVVVPLAEYRRLRALARLASPDDLDGAEAAAAIEEYREWLAAGRPGAVSHEQARGLLLGPDHG
jgi:hypothetical protein